MAVTSSSSARVTPGSTIATWFSVSISIRFIRSNDTTTPPSLGIAAPAKPVPLPRAVTGDAVLVAHAEDRCDLARGLWQEDRNRDDRRRAERLVVRVLVVRIAGEDAIGGQDTVEQCRHDVVRCSLLPWIRLARLTSRWGTDIPGR